MPQKKKAAKTTPAQAKQQQRVRDQKKKTVFLSGKYLPMIGNAVKKYAPVIKKYGVDLKKSVVFATAMLESADPSMDPENFIHPKDNGLGIMQLTPLAPPEGKTTADVYPAFDPNVAQIIGWNNSKSVDYNIALSTAGWRDPAKNIMAGVQTMVNKAKVLANNAKVGDKWDGMTADQKQAAMLYAYNRGQGKAITAIANDKTGKYAAVSAFPYVKNVNENLSFLAANGPFSSAPPAPPSEYDPPGA